MGYTNSPLVIYTKLSPNHSGQRTHSIDRITPHCVVGQLSAESICGCFTSPTRQASCNYGIGTDGRVSLCVEEKNRSWCSSSNSNDQRAVTIECASDMNEPYAMNSAVYNSLVKLCIPIPGSVHHPGRSRDCSDGVPVFYKRRAELHTDRPEAGCPAYPAAEQRMQTAAKAEADCAASWRTKGRR